MKTHNNLIDFHFNNLMMLLFFLLPLMKAKYEMPLNRMETEEPDFTPCITNKETKEFNLACLAQASINSMNSTYYITAELGSSNQKLNLTFTTFDDVT